MSLSQASPNRAEAIAISGFEITGTLYEGDTFLLLLAQRKVDGREVCLKTTVSPYPRREALNQLNNEFAIGSRLKGDCFPEYLEKIAEGKRIFLVLQQIRGINLRRFLDEESPADKQLLNISISICEILRELEANKVIHKDLKPENLVLDERTGRVYLIDFGLSTRNVRSEAGAGTAGLLEGTPAYLSPEQTGKTNWPLDHRTDFYAFGCCLYLFFTGRLPFVTSDPLELLHYQVARMPTAPILLNERIPAPLSDLIVKLLAKSPADRYLTAEGIYQDFLRIRDEWDRPALLAELKIGQRDIPARFFPGQQILGREKELSTLDAAFQSVQKGGKRLVLIEGVAGVGKTELVHAFRNQLREADFQYGSGRFSRDQEDFSRSGFVGMLRHLLQEMLSLEEQSLAQRKQRLESMLGSGLAVLAPILPELALICGEQPPAESLSGQEERNRFFYAAVSLIRALHVPGKVIVLFLDDLQWADATSLRLIEELVFEGEIEGLLLIACYRTSREPLEAVLAESVGRLERSGLAVRMLLAPLTLGATRTLVTSILGAHPRAGELAVFLFRRTEGIPLLQSQLLWLIQEQGLFQYNPAAGYWDFELAALQRLPLSRDFAEMARDRAAALPRGTVEVLSAAAILGFRFSRRVLIELAGIPEPQVERALVRATEKGIVIPVPVDRQDAAEALAFPHDHRFMHRSLHGYFYSLRDKEERVHLHYRVGELLMDISGRATDKNPLAFEILAHLNEAGGLVGTPEARRELVLLNQLAAREARRGGRYEQAIGYWEVVHRRLAAEPDLLPVAQRFEFEYQFAETQFLAGNHPDAEATFRKLLDEAPPERYYPLVRTYLQLLIALGRHEDVLAVGEVALRKSSVTKPLPKGKSRIRFSVLRSIAGLRLRLSGKRMDKIGEMERTQNPEVGEIIRVYRDLGISALSINPDLFGAVVLREMEMTLRHGLHPYAITVFMSYAILTAIGLKDYKTALKLADLSFFLSEREGIKVEAPESEYGRLHFIEHLRRPVRELLPKYLQVYEQLRQAGNPVFAGFAVNSRVWCMVCLGLNLDEVREEMKGYLRTFQMKGKEESIVMMEPRYQFILGLQGEFADPWKLQHADYDFEGIFNRLERRGSFPSLGGMVISKLQLCWLFAQYGEGIRIIERGDRFISNMEGMLFVADYYLFHALTFASAFLESGRRPGRAEAKRMKALLKRMERLSKQEPQNYEPHYLLMRAAQGILKGRNEAVPSDLDLAIASAGKHKFTPVYAAANELAHRWVTKVQPGGDALRYLFDAHQAYLLWGATAKARQLEELYPEEFARKEVPAQATGTETSTRSPGGSFDLQSILKASEVIAGEIRLSDLVQTLLRVLVENVGAEKGCFVRVQSGKLQLEVVGEMQANAFETQVVQRPVEGILAPATVLRYVLRTGKDLVLNLPENHGHFANDPYFAIQKPQSLLCHPVLYQGDPIALIYLESKQVSQSFDAERRELIALLSGQIGISLQNALLYEELEDKVRARTATVEQQKVEIEREKRKSDALLRNILPERVARELKESGRTPPRHYEQVSILFSDIVGFTQFAEERSPAVLVRDLDRYFSAVDEIMERHGLEKIKTIGDAYLCVGGLAPEAKDPHAATVRAGLAMLGLVADLRAEGLDLQIRVGIHTGPVVAGVVGTKKFAYDIWGDAVNIAARMEAAGAPGKVNVSQPTYELVRDRFVTTGRGAVEAKHKGEMQMYFVEGERPQ
ncbi:MAG: adenylate/guanylate cyclase domain-containing protein [Bacteroidota bacterium]